MVDVSLKQDTVRSAIAKGQILFSPQIDISELTSSNKKGDVLTVARIAGISMAKQTSALIPLCHNIPISKVNVDFKVQLNPPKIEAECLVKTVGKTGVEMEALSGCTGALLTIYDMCKAADKNMIIDQVRVVYKEGGKSGTYIGH